jgi:hypothetical protein
MTMKSNILASGQTAGFPRTFAGALVDPPASNDCGGVLPEFGRVRDVERIFGIKRGILYRKIADGKIRSVSLREPGKKFGCRLIHLASVRAWLHREMAEQCPIELPVSVCPQPQPISNLLGHGTADLRSSNEQTASAA